MSNWFIGEPSVIADSPPPGVRLPWWNRTKPRRLAGCFGRGLRVVIHNPRYLTIAAILPLLLYGPYGVAAAVLMLALAFNLWVHLRPVQARSAAVGWWRSNRRYRWQWGRTLRRCGAAKLDTPVPLLRRVRSTSRNRRPLVDKLRIQIPTGLDPSAFYDYRGELLQWGWRALSTRVFNPNPKNQTVELWNVIEDILIDPVAPLPPSTEVLPKAGLQMALVEDGEWWHLKIRGNQAAHVFVCGISGSGKGSYIAALLDRQSEGIQQKTVEAWGIDPQASELGMSRHLFKKIAFTREDAAAMLEQLIVLMDKRTRSMFGITRQHQPTPGDPFIELVIDEGLDLLDKTDRKLYRRIDTALRELLRKGRKASIRVSFISQRAELDIVEIRKLFQIWIAFQLGRDIDVDMVLGRGALASGAKAHEISYPGTIYIGSDEGILRARFPHYTDEHIQAMPSAPGNEDRKNLPRLPGEKRVMPEGMPMGGDTKPELVTSGRLTDL